MNGQEHEIEIYDVNSDFNMFVRSEGAYAYWKEPENFLEALNIPNTYYHGNCKSYIGQNSIALARPKRTNNWLFTMQGKYTFISGSLGYLFW